MSVEATPAFSDPFQIPSGECLCGCRQPAKKRFVMGHDGRLRARLVRIAREGVQPDRDAAIEALRRLDWLHFLMPAKPDTEASSPMAQTREATLAACRAALGTNCPGYREIVKDELFQVGPYFVRPKGTGTKDGEWIWDVQPGARVESKESFYLLYDVKEPDAFYIVPSDYVRGALEGAHYRWFQEGREVDDDGDIVNYRTLDSSTRRIGKWPVEPYVNRWDLLTGLPAKSGRQPKPIRDTETGTEYPSEGAAGRALYHLVNGDPKNTFVWYKIVRAFPQRFQTKNAAGDWVSLDDPTAPRGSTLSNS